MRKRKVAGKVVAAGERAADQPRPGERSSRAVRASPSAKKSSSVRNLRGEPANPPAAVAAPPETGAAPPEVEPGADAGTLLLGELRGLRAMVERLTPTAPTRVPDALAKDDDPALEGAVDSLRRLLSELIERRLERVVSDVVSIRREAAALATVSRGERVVERLDQLLDSLGAVRFDAEPMTLLDPLIHTVAGERHEDGVPDGVVLETARSGYRSARRLILCKAAVVVNRRSERGAVGH